MSNNPFFKTAVMALLIMIFGSMVTIIVLVAGEQNPAHAQNAVVDTAQNRWEPTLTQGLSGKYMAVPVRVSSNEEGLAIIDPKAGKVIFYRNWGGKNFYPVAGRKISQDFEILDKLTKRSFSDVRANDSKFSPEKIEEILSGRN